MIRRFFILGMIVLLVGIAIYQNKSLLNKETISRVEAAPKVGFKAPSFTLQSLDGKTYTVPSNGKPIILNFWVSWCEPCQLEAPTLEEFSKKYNKEVQFYGLNLTRSDSIEDVKEFKKEFGYTFPILLDLKDQIGKIYQVNAFPTTYFIDKRGIIVSIETGMVDPQALKSKITQLITD